MRRFIYGERDGIYIIDLLKTEALLRQRAGLRRADRRTAAAPSCSSARRSRPATPSRTPPRRAGMPYVNHRWLGGLLTNFQTISQRIKRLHDLERYEAEGQLALLPTRERLAAEADLAKLRANLGGVKHMQRPPDAIFVIDLKTEEIARARGPAPAHPDHRPGRHQLRPGRHRLRHPGQRRRDPLLRGHRRRASATSSPRRACVPRRGGAGPPGGRASSSAARPRSGPRKRGRGAGRAPTRPRRPPPPRSSAGRGRGGRRPPPRRPPAPAAPPGGSPRRRPPGGRPAAARRRGRRRPEGRDRGRARAARQPRAVAGPGAARQRPRRRRRPRGEPTTEDTPA